MSDEHLHIPTGGIEKLIKSRATGAGDQERSTLPEASIENGSTNQHLTKLSNGDADRNGEEVSANSHQIVVDIPQVVGPAVADLVAHVDCGDGISFDVPIPQKPEPNEEGVDDSANSAFFEATAGQLALLPPAAGDKIVGYNGDDVRAEIAEMVRQTADPTTGSEPVDMTRYITGETVDPKVAEEAFLKKQEEYRIKRYLNRLRAQSERQQDIYDHLDAISEIVNKRLHQTVLFTREDMDLGVSAVSGVSIVDSAKGIDHVGLSHPNHVRNNISISGKTDITTEGTVQNEGDDEELQKFLTTESIPTTTELVADVASRSTGETAGVEFLRTILGESVEISANVREALTTRMLAEQKRHQTRFHKKEIHQVINELTNEEAWQIISDAYESVAISQSLKAHDDFFECLNPDSFLRAQKELDEDENNAITGSEYESFRNELMMEDFKKLCEILGWEKGIDYEILKKGSGVAYMKARLHDRSGRKNAIVRIREYSGENIASIGSNSFMAIVDANIDKTNAHKGAFLVMAYKPQMPVHMSELATTRLNSDGIREIIPENERENIHIQPSEVSWRLRVWHITDHGQADVMRRLQKLAKHPDTDFVPFVNPLETIEELFPLIEALFKVRSGFAQGLDGFKNYVVGEMERAVGDAANGEQIDLDGMIGVISSLNRLHMPEAATKGGVHDLVKEITSYLKGVEVLKEQARLLLDTHRGELEPSTDDRSESQASNQVSSTESVSFS